MKSPYPRHPLCRIGSTGRPVNRAGIEQVSSSRYLLSFADKADTVIELEDGERFGVGDQLAVTEDGDHRRARARPQVCLGQRQADQRAVAGSRSQDISIVPMASSRLWSRRCSSLELTCTS